MKSLPLFSGGHEKQIFQGRLPPVGVEQRPRLTSDLAFTAKEHEEPLNSTRCRHADQAADERGGRGRSNCSTTCYRLNLLLAEREVRFLSPPVCVQLKGLSLKPFASAEATTDASVIIPDFFFSFTNTPLICWAIPSLVWLHFFNRSFCSSSPCCEGNPRVQWS